MLMFAAKRCGVVAALFFAPLLVHAQNMTITCDSLVTADCKANVGLSDAMEQARIKVRIKRNGSPVPGAIVTFTASSGTVKPDTVIASVDGLAQAIWFRYKGSDAAAVAVNARMPGLATPPGVSEPVLIALTATDPEPKKIVLLDVAGTSQSWFQKSQTPRTIKVELKTPPGEPTISPATCTKSQIVFKLRGAPQTVSPDTASGVMDDRGSCFAETYWTMGDGFGERRIDIKVAPGKGFESNTLTAEGWTRATPRFIGGFAAGHLKGYTTLNPAAQRVVHIERIDASGTKLSFDTTVITGQPTLLKVDPKTEYSAVAALSLPIPLAFLGRNDNLAFTIGVDISKPTERQFYGMSVLQLLGRWVPVIEALPIDFHVLKFYAKQPRLSDPGCAIADCQVKNRIRPQGWAVMLSADATQLITDVVKKLNP